MDSNENNSSHAVHPSPPLPGGQTSLLDPNSRRNYDKNYEELIRRIVREEMCVREDLGKKSHYNLLPPRMLSDPNTSAQYQLQYQLQFLNQVKNTTFTTDLVRDENGHAIKVAMYDTYTKPKSIISGDNILSSAKVKLILLDAEFCTNSVNWSPSEFVQNVLRERERKGPILAGRNLIIQLENGVGIFENIVFNDNSSWTKSGFRLGIMVKGEGEEGYLNGQRVREGVSESFRVKDRRMKAFQPDRLKLAHSVRCIKKIGKDRASLLQKENIETVEDFRRRLENDGPALRKILCIKSESSKEWESMVEHVKQCANEYDSECIASNNSSQPQQALVDPTERKMPLGTNVGHDVVGSGSSEPNPSENDKSGGHVPETYNPLVPGYCKPQMNFPNELKTDFPQMNFWDEWEKQKKKHSVNEFGSMQRTNGVGFLQSELPFDQTLDDYLLIGQMFDNPTTNYTSSGGGGGGGGRSHGGRFPPSELPFDPSLPNHSFWGPHDASALNYTKSFLWERCGCGCGGGGGGGCGRFPQPELSLDPFLPNHSFRGAHVASAPNYNQSFLGAGGNNGSGGGGSGSAGACAGGNNGSSGGGSGGGSMEDIVGINFN